MKEVNSKTARKKQDLLIKRKTRRLLKMEGRENHNASLLKSLFVALLAFLGLFVAFTDTTKETGVASSLLHKTNNARQ